MSLLLWLGPRLLLQRALLLEVAEPQHDFPYKGDVLFGGSYPSHDLLGSGGYNDVFFHARLFWFCELLSVTNRHCHSTLRHNLIIPEHIISPPTFLDCKTGRNHSLPIPTHP